METGGGTSAGPGVVQRVTDAQAILSELARCLRETAYRAGEAHCSHSFPPFRYPCHLLAHLPHPTGSIVPPQGKACVSQGNGPCAARVPTVRSFVRVCPVQGFRLRADSTNPVKPTRCPLVSPRAAPRSPEQIRRNQAGSTFNSVPGVFGMGERMRSFSFPTARTPSSPVQSVRVDCQSGWGTSVSRNEWL